MKEAREFTVYYKDPFLVDGVHEDPTVYTFKCWAANSREALTKLRQSRSYDAEVRDGRYNSDRFKRVTRVRPFRVVRVQDAAVQMETQQNIVVLKSHQPRWMMRNYTHRK